MSMAPTVEGYLSERAIPYSTRPHAASSTSLASAHAAHVDEDCVAKSVVLEDDRGCVLAVLPASRRLELDRVRDELGRSLHLAEEQGMASLFPDCRPGAIPPVGAAYGLPTVLDASLEGREVVYFEGGDHETLVRVEGDVFLDLLDKAIVADIATESSVLSAALVARERLYDELLALSRAIAAPVGSGQRWRERVARALDRVARSLEKHVEETEGRGGILREIVDQAPRLWREIDALEREHEELTDACARLEERLERGASALAIRRKVLDLLGRFDHHRHRGADLVYEAFGVDIGGG